MSDVKLVPAVLRASALLDHVAARPGRTLSELARELSLPKSSVHALCQTLCHLSLLLEDRGGFHIGPHAATWARAGGSLIDDFTRSLAEDAVLSAQTVTLSVMDGREVVYQACHNSPAPLGILFRVGMRLPAAFTATGRAMLAALPDTMRKAFLDADLPAPLTRHSVTTVAALEQELDATAQRGFSIDAGEVREGMSCFGAAITNAAGLPCAAIAVSMTTSEARPDMVARITPALTGLARRLSGRP